MSSEVELGDRERKRVFEIFDRHNSYLENLYDAFSYVANRQDNMEDVEGVVDMLLRLGPDEEGEIARRYPPADLEDELKTVYEREKRLTELEEKRERTFRRMRHKFDRARVQYLREIDAALKEEQPGPPLIE